MGRIYDDITQTIGHTPLVRLNRLTEGCVAEVTAKLEFFNPLSSIKDRIGLAMIEAAERDGKLQPGATLIEPTSGNTGIALAFVAAVKGYRLILTMPEQMSVERRALLRGLGAEIVLTPTEEAMHGAVNRAYALAKTIPDAVVLHQFTNPANPEIHETTTAVEIWEDTGGEVDALVAGVGTGGSISGTGRALKARRPEVRVIAVEPSRSAVLSGKRPGIHAIQGIGAGFVPENFDRGVVDEVCTVTDDEALTFARRLAREEGIPAGFSSGAACKVAIDVARRPEMEGKRIVVLFASCAERYLSTKLYRDLV
jgi:cysteine synthase A